MQICNIDFEKNAIDEKVLVIIILGILDALFEQKITIVESQKCLFSPYIVNSLVNLKCKKEIVDLIEKGCELEDVESLLPSKLKDNICLLRNDALIQLNELEKYENEKWIHIVQD